MTCMWTGVPSPLFSSYHNVLLHHLLLGFDCCLNQHCAFSKALWLSKLTNSSSGSMRAWTACILWQLWAVWLSCFFPLQEVLDMCLDQLGFPVCEGAVLLLCLF